MLPKVRTMPASKKIGRRRKLTIEQYKANQMANTAKWRKQHTKSVNFALNIEKDADIIEWLEQHKPKQRYIRDLIRRDMDKGN